MASTSSNLYEPEEEETSTLGLLVFLPAVLATLGLMGYWMHRIHAKDASSSHQRPLTHQSKPEPTAPRPYSMYDLIAGCGTGFLLNMCITIVVPVALSSAESRGHSAPLAVSGTVAAATSI